MTEKKTNTFTKHWEKEFETKDKEATRFVKITTVDQEDFKEKRNGKYGEENVYQFTLLAPDGKKDATLIINESKDYLGALEVDGKKMVIKKFINEDGVSMCFKYEDYLPWTRVEKRKDKNGDMVYKIKFSYVVNKDDLLEDNNEDEIPF